ncbi:serine protease inhibitor [Arthrobacter sp. CDRTa11]|uniref:SSI family serine proteinase inhibitor n=1 Tax=Arthrobacter sp. CDRTa11 TaxID=2651199 RepID=UPI002265D2DC|nr:SSI family serine proteinase inhibitor [Arthrobacter sp. CDRTa11]UZX01814.1 serine protease inhibitor [Arthrobacter sp. CDRTa11]
MRKLLIQAAALLLAAGLMSACSAPDTGAPTSTTPAASSPTTSGTATTPAADTETSVSAPAPSASRSPAAGPGAGNAELAITVRPSETEPAVNYTLVCQDGVPAAESKHLSAEAACEAIKNNAAVLSPSAQDKDQACTEQYGGPQQATVTGIVDGTPVESTFARRNGCEISAWDAARDILGASGGAA